MSVASFRQGSFPFPVPTAVPWIGTDLFQIPIFDQSDPTIRDYNLYIPGKTGPALTSGVLYADGSPVLNFVPVVGAGTLYPCGMSLDAAMKLYWRVQAWAYSNTYTNPDGTETQSNTIYTGGTNNSATGVNSSRPATPAAMTPPLPGIRYFFDKAATGIKLYLAMFDASIVTSDNLIQNDPNFVWYGGFADGLFMGGNGSPPLVCYEPIGKLYYPLILFGPDFLNYDGNYSSMTSKFEIIGGATHGPGVGTLSFTEATLAFAFASTFTDGGGTTVSESATLVPSAYWPYDPGDGLGPYYDATTGAPLR